MNAPPENRSALLDDVLAGDHGGNPLTERNVLALIRRERAARKRRHRRVAMAAGAALTAAGVLLIQQPGTVPEPQMPRYSPRVSAERVQANEPREIEIDRIGDEELLRLLGDQPAALVELPDGERRLLVLVGGGSSRMP